MPLKDLEGSTYGPFAVRVSSEQVAAYVAVTGDDADRWSEHAPPSFAGALLFAAAPAFLYDDAVRPYTRLLVHADQSFRWHRALAVGEAVSVGGVLTRVRTMGGVGFASFEATVTSGGEPVIDATSTFLMGDGAPEVVAPEEEEPPIEERDRYDSLPAGSAGFPASMAEMVRSASRLDLVRYASASGDFNPVHFDHATARRAGFGGVLVHGLLMGSWVLQLAAAHSHVTDAIESAKLRFRNPLRPARSATVAGEVREVSSGLADLRMSLKGRETEYVDGRVKLRMG